MAKTVTTVESIRPITRSAATGLAATEHERVLELLRTLSQTDWSRPTECELWDVRAMVGHMLGMMEGFTSLSQWVHQMRAGRKAAGDGPFIDGMTAAQVRERADLTVEQLVERVAIAGPRAARARGRVPAPFRHLPLKEEVGGKTETWKLGYLLDVILTRDPWMHRGDITRATGREHVLTPEHDGRIVADVVAEWARRHGRPFTLELEGPAGGTFQHGDGGERTTLDTVEFCRILSGRAEGTGLLSTEVPF